MRYGVRVVSPDAPASPPSHARFASSVAVGGTARFIDDGSAATHEVGYVSLRVRAACMRVRVPPVQDAILFLTPRGEDRSSKTRGLWIDDPLFSDELC
jgi:hypothetical protein